VLKVRIIPTLLYKDFGLVKGVGFDSRRAVGSPMQAIKVYEMRGVDELLFLDVAATPNESGPDLGLIDDLADECFMPLTVGGGVRSVDDVGEVLSVGADKVCLGTAAVASPRLVSQASERFGAQCIVVSIDVGENGEVLTHCGRCPTGRDVAEVASTMQDAGAGELLIQSVHLDGTMRGYDLDSLAQAAAATSIPLIASGGAGSYEHFHQALSIDGVRAVAAASMFHFTEQTPAGAKDYLRERSVPVRK
jgi:cyclase